MSGCITTVVTDDEPAFASLLNDESCGLLYSMAESCHALGATDPGEESCGEFAFEMRDAFAGILDNEESLLTVEEYCTMQCGNGIKGEKVPEPSQVCL